MKINKFFVLLLSGFLLFGCMNPTGFAQETIEKSEETLIGVSDDVTQLIRYNQVLLALGITQTQYQDVSQWNAVVTKADFVSFLLKLSKLTVIPEPSAFYYIDVDDKTPLYKEIYYISDLGLMSGQNGMFKPNNALDMGDLQKAFLKLGNNDFGLNGKNDMNFAVRVSELGLLRGISYTQKEVTYGILVRMMHNLMYSKYCELDFFNESGNAQYKIKGTFMEVRLQVEKITGLITATNISGLYSPGHLIDGFIQIDNTVFECGVDASRHLGYTVDAYVDVSGQNNRIIYLNPTKKNKTIKMTGNLIKSYSEGVLQYYEDLDSSKIEKAVIDKNAIVISNQKYMGTIVNLTLNELLLIDSVGNEISGDMVLVDNNSDDIYDVLIRSEYRTIWVASADNNERIYADMDGNVIDLSEYNKINVYDGEVITDIKSIKANQVLSVAVNDSLKYAIIHISKTQTDGILDATQENEYQVGEKWYQLSGYLIGLISNEVVKTPEVGKSYIYYMDMFGKLAYVQEKSSALQYGYLVGVSKSAGLSELVKVKLFTRSGEFEIMDLDKRIIIDDSSCKAMEVYDSEALFTTEKQLKEQLIKYRLNSYGKIKEIWTANKDDVKTDINLKNVTWHSEKNFALNFTGSLRFKSYLMSTFGNKFYSKDIVWAIPTDIKDENSFGVYNVQDYFKNDQSYTLEIYDADEYGKIGAILLKSASSSDNYNNGPAIVQSVSYVLNKNGESTRQVKLIENGIAKKLVYDTGKTLTDASVGDIMRYNVNAKGEINSLSIDFKYEKDAAYFTNITEDLNHTGTEKYVGYGLIASIDKINRMVQFSTNGLKSSKVYIYGDRLPVYLFDIQKQKVTQTTIDSIHSVLSHGEAYASRVLITARYFNIESITIYKD